MKYRTKPMKIGITHKLGLKVSVIYSKKIEEKEKEIKNIDF